MSTTLLWGIVAGLTGFPLGYLVGWLSGHHEHVLRSRADCKAGVCNWCGKRMDLSHNPHNHR